MVEQVQDTKRISDFLDSLVSDPDRELLFDKEPIAVMSEYGLNQRQQRLLLKGTLDEIRAEINNELGNADFVVYFIKMK
jgi:hypothetical protein